jgi:hypothetical protein
MGLRAQLVVKHVNMCLYNTKFTSVHGNYSTILQCMKQRDIQNKITNSMEKGLP